MKPYPPVMREKRRYIKFRLECEQKLSRNDAIRAIWDNVFDYIGIFGTVETSFWIMDFDENKQEGIIRANNISVKRVLSALCMLDKVSNKKALIHIIKVTGTIKKAKNLSEI